MNELIFTVDEAPEGGYSARAAGVSIFTAAKTLEELYRNIREAIQCHFKNGFKGNVRVLLPLTDGERRVLNAVRDAFTGVVLGEGIGLRQGQGLDDYADAHTLATYREQDEKHDWSAIPAADLDECYSSLSFFDAEGMRFHLPAYLVAQLKGQLQTADVLFHLAYTENGAQSPFEKLSLAQREAVRAFLLLRLADPHREFERPRIEAALRDYWNTR